MPASKVCAQPGCPTLIPKTQRHCPQHKAEKNRARGTTTQRGYGTQHQRLRRAWAARIQQGGINCARCGKPIHPGQPFDLGHTDDRTDWTGPECPTCNRSAGGRAAHPNSNV